MAIREPPWWLLGAATCLLGAAVGQISTVAYAQDRFLGYAAREPTPDPSVEQSLDRAVASRFKRQVVLYPSGEAPGTVIIDTAHTFLYVILGDGKALRYGIGVGREGFTWSGVQAVSRKAEWPDWIPPEEMIRRQPYLPRFVAGGLGNPLGARAIYLGATAYRIHGTNDPSSIGKHVSSGCIRMNNEDVIDLYNRVTTGTKVIVLLTDRSPRVEYAVHTTRPGNAPQTASPQPVDARAPVARLGAVAAPAAAAFRLY